MLSLSPIRRVIALAVATVPVAAAPPALAGDDPDLVLFRQAAAAPTGELALLPGLPVQLLNAAGDKRRVAVAELPRGWSRRLPARRAHTLELLVLEGELTVDGKRLGPYHYAHLPAGAPAPAWTAGARGTRLLLFLDPPRDTDGEAGRVLDSTQLPWRAGVVAQRDTGRTLAVEVKDLLWVESTGQRTWLLRMGTDFSLPWEVHDTVEEGYLLEGTFRLGECLDQGALIGEYRPGGYFYRPAGIAHGGSQAGTDSLAVFLLRTPVNLTVRFLADCAGQP